MFLLGAIHRRIELDKRRRQLGLLAVADMDRPDTPISNGWTTLLRPLGTILPWARRDDVDRRPRRPGDRQTEHGDDHEHDGAADRRGRGLDDLERRRQECQFQIAPAREPDAGNGTTRAEASFISALPTFASADMLACRRCSAA